MQTVVHTASTTAVNTVLERLSSRGIDAVAIDQPNVIALIIAFGTYRVRIAVPDEQVAEAKAVLEEWDREARPNVKRLSRQVYRQFFVAGIGAFLVAGGIFVLGNVWYAVPAFLVVWLGLVVLLGVLERGRVERGVEGKDDGV